MVNEIDEKIISLYEERNEKAIEMTDIHYGRFSRTLSYNILNSLEDAEECVNDSYMRLWETIPPTVPQSLKAYLGRIVRNISLSLFRKKKADKRNDDTNYLLSELGDCIPSNNDVEQAVDHLQLVELLEVWLTSEKRQNRRLFILRYWYGIPTGELAKRFNLSEKKTTDLLYRMRQRLKKFLEKEGVSV